VNWSDEQDISFYCYRSRRLTEKDFSNRLHGSLVTIKLCESNRQKVLRKISQIDNWRSVEIIRIKCLPLPFQDEVSLRCLNICSKLKGNKNQNWCMYFALPIKIDSRGQRSLFTRHELPCDTQRHIDTLTYRHVGKSMSSVKWICKLSLSMRADPSRHLRSRIVLSREWTSPSSNRLEKRDGEGTDKEWASICGRERERAGERRGSRKRDRETEREGRREQR